MSLSRAPATFDANKANSPLSVPAANTAVLLMDYQNMLISFLGEDGKAAVPVAVALRDWAVARQMPVYHCVFRTNGPGSSAPANHKFADVWPNFEAALQGDPTLGHECDELAPKNNQLEKLIDRKVGLISALWSEGLQQEFEEKKIRSLIICGLSTSGCVLGTARDAADKGYIVTIVRDACGDQTAELHDQLMDKVLATTAHVANLADMQTGWEAVSG